MVVVDQLLHDLARVAADVMTVGVARGLALGATFAAVAGMQVLVLLHAHDVILIHILLNKVRGHSARCQGRN